MNASLPLAAALLAALATLASGIEVPKKSPLTRYAPLWNESPFTTKPPPPESTPEANPFDDLALRGIAPLANGGYLITVADKKKPDETDVIDTERSKEYQVIKVERDPTNRLGTVVHLKKGSMTGTITYDEKVSSAPKTAQVKKPQGQPGQQPPQAAGQPPQPQVPGQPVMPSGIRPPRQRVVTPGSPPTPGASPGTPGATPIPPNMPGGSGFNRGSSSGRPDIRGSHSGQERPSHR
jgi:hypothetical protein